MVSFLLPRRLHQDFYNVYAYCRWADDLGDEMGDTAESLRLLDWWRGELDAMYAGEATHPVFVALRGTVERHGIPRQPFDDLIRAFVQDQTVTRYRDPRRTCSTIAATRPTRWGGWCSTSAATPTRSGSGSPTPPARRCNWPISGRTWRWT